MLRGGVMAKIRARTTSWAANSDWIRRGRERRYRLFMELCGVRPDERILDVGAGHGAALERFNTENPIVAVDLLAPTGAGWLGQANVEVAQADGTRLPYADREFPVAFSSSVIEHVPKELQAAFASEGGLVVLVESPDDVLGALDAVSTSSELDLGPSRRLVAELKEFIAAHRRAREGSDS